MLFYFIGGTGFALGASCLLGKCHTPWAALSVPACHSITPEYVLELLSNVMFKGVALINSSLMSLHIDHPSGYA
jgi:hypothetical protein